MSLGYTSPGIRASSIARGAAVVIYNIIDEVPAINSARDGGQKPDTVVGDIIFDNVDFIYPARPDVQVDSFILWCGASLNNSLCANVTNSFSLYFAYLLSL